LSPADETTETEVELLLMFELLRMLCESDAVVAAVSVTFGIVGTELLTSVFTDNSNRGSSCSRA
jgi:hypothetical protein